MIAPEELSITWVILSLRIPRINHGEPSDQDKRGNLPIKTWDCNHQLLLSPVEPEREESKLETLRGKPTVFKS